MSDRAKKVSELTVTASVANGDLFIIGKVAANTTNTVTGNTLATYVAGKIARISNGTSNVFVTTSGGNVTISSAGNTWIFDTNGAFTFPGSIVGASFTANSTVVTTTGNFTGNTNGVALGYRDVPQNFTNTSFTLAANDAGKHVLTQNTGSSTQTITIANNTSVAFQTGAAITIVVQSTGTVAVANGAGVTMYLAGNSTAKSTVTLNSYSMATLLKIGTDTWMISGTGAT